MKKSIVLFGTAGWIVLSTMMNPGRAQNIPSPEPRMNVLAQVSALTGVSDSLLHDGKCGFRWMANVARRLEFLAPSEAERITSMLKPTSAAVETVIGHFRIAFDTSGLNAPALLDSLNNRIPGTARAYVDSVGKIFEEVWALEVAHLEYVPPPMTGGAYDITITELGGEYYGQTVYGLPYLVDGNTSFYRSFIEIDNDFREYRTKGMDGLKVTAAHEFHHSIQIGSYGIKWNGMEFLDLFAYEITSTWLEDVVYPSINDYLQYLPDFFGSSTTNGYTSGRSLVNTIWTGYERCIWGHFLSERYGSRTMTSVWGHMRTKRFLAATESALLERNVSFATAFANFSYWNYYTADHADPSRAYADGPLFPQYRRLQRVTFNGSSAQTSASMERLSSTMVDFVIGTDTLTTIIANVDVEGARENYNIQQDAEVLCARDRPNAPYQILENGLYVGVSVPNPVEWRSFFLGSATRGEFPRVQKHPYPNPIRLREDDGLILPVDAVPGGKAEVLVMTSSANRVLYGWYSIIAVQGSSGVFLPSAVLRDRASSGVYTVALTTGGKDYLWKIVIIQ